MCRHAAYLGPARTVGPLLLDGPHSLLVQSYKAKELLSGVVNADGFGAAWYGPHGSGDEVADARAPPGTPAVYRSTLPIWADASFESITRRVRAHCVVANLRNATEAGTTDRSNVHPFDDGRFVFSHNGDIEGFRARLMRRMRQDLSDAQYARLAGVTESETVFRLLCTRMEREGLDMVEAARHVVTDVIAQCRTEGLRCQMNVIVSDGERLVATRASGKGPANSLYTLHGNGVAGEGTIVASEPFDDDPGWKEVPHQSVVVVESGMPPRVTPLE